MKGSIRTIVFYFILTKKKIRWLACVSKKKNDWLAIRELRLSLQ